MPIMDILCFPLLFSFPSLLCISPQIPDDLTAEEKV